MLEVRCPRCQTLLTAENHHLGARVGCKRCGHVFPLEVAYPEGTAPASTGPAAGADSDVLYILEEERDTRRRGTRVDLRLTKEPAPARNPERSPERASARACSDRASCCPGAKVVRGLLLLGILAGALAAALAWTKARHRGCAGLTVCPSAVVPTPSVHGVSAEFGPMMLGRHPADLTGIAVSPDGKLLAAADRDGTLRLWDAVVGRNRHHDLSAAGKAAPVAGLAFSRDGKRLAAAGTDGVLRVYDSARRTESLSVPLFGDGKGSAGAVAFGGNDRLAVGCSDGSVRVIDLPCCESCEVVSETLRASDRPVNAVAFSPDGKYLAAGSADGAVRTWNSEDLKADAKLQPGFREVSSLTFSPDGKTLAIAAADGTIYLGRPGDSRLEYRRLIGSSAPAAALAFFRDAGDREYLAAAGRDGTVRFWEPAIGAAPRQVIRAHRDGGCGLVVAPGEAFLATAGGREIKLWDLASLLRHPAPLLSCLVEPERCRN
jgi:WD40 repeat protein